MALSDRVIVYTYFATFLWCFGWWLIRPPSQTNQFFREGGPIDLLNSTWMIAAAVLAWITWMIAGGSRLRRFWLVCALGLLFLGVDERFQFHEILGRAEIVDPPFGMRNWSDPVVLLYGVVAVLLIVPVIGVLWRERRLRYLGLATVLLAGMSTGIDTLVSSGPRKDIVEETFKVLAGAGFFLTFAEGFCLELRSRGNRVAAPELPRRIHALVLFLLCAVLVWVTLGGTTHWHYLVSRYWGSAHSWVACVLLWSTALLLILHCLLQLRSGHTRRPLWFPLALYLGLLGAGEGIRATRIQVMHDRVIDQFPGSIGLDLAVMHDPVGISNLTFLVSVVALVVCGREVVRTQPRAWRWLLAAAALLVLSMIVNIVAGNVGNDLLGPLLRIAGSACALLGAITILVDGTRPPSPAPG